jgi:16S rRNA (adenine1518-N6/adenine1519-N6)-dimethyltransferase
MAHRARKRFGQNFLHDTGIIAKIVAAIQPAPNDHFIEIGPGHGAITKLLAAIVKTLEVIEIDTDLADELESQDWFAKVRLHRGDALEFDFASVNASPGSLRLVGNLPYNISTPLLFHILDHYTMFRDVHVMLQKEVVQRMTAEPGNKSYGRLTVALAARCRVESLFVIKPGAFTPAPQVDSAFARLTPLPEPLIQPAEQDDFDEVLRHAFGQRRKQLGNALGNLLDGDRIAAAGIDPQRRAETLEVGDFVRLAQQLRHRE